MSIPDIEKAREALRKIMLYSQHDRGVTNLTNEALRALDGDGAEEWTAHTGPFSRYQCDGGWAVWCGSSNLVAVCASPEYARRIAKLPRLEKAAWRVLHSNEQTGPCAYSNLRDALKQEVK